MSCGKARRSRRQQAERLDAVAKRDQEKAETTEQLLQQIAHHAGAASNLIWQLYHEPTSSPEDWAERVTREVGCFDLTGPHDKGQLPGVVKHLRENLATLERYLAAGSAEEPTANQAQVVSDSSANLEAAGRATIAAFSKQGQAS